MFSLMVVYIAGGGMQQKRSIIDRKYFITWNKLRLQKRRVVLNVLRSLPHFCSEVPLISSLYTTYYKVYSRCFGLFYVERQLNRGGFCKYCLSVLWHYVDLLVDRYQYFRKTLCSSLALNMETVFFSEMLVSIWESTQRRNPKHLHLHRRKNLTSHIVENLLFLPKRLSQ